MKDWKGLFLLLNPALILLAVQYAGAVIPSNCSHSYTLRVDDDHSSSSHCIQTVGGGSSGCSSLTDFLSSFKEVIPPGGCLQLSLEPGQYTMSTSKPTNLNYSLSVLAPNGGVTFSCDSGGEAASSYVPLRINKTRSEISETFVSLDGLLFEGCSQPLEFNHMDSVTITNCGFRDFTASAVDLFNVKNITIQQSTFTDCSTNVAKEQFRANSGALSIAYATTKQPPPNTTDYHPTTLISDCTFIRNRAILPPNSSREQINLALNMNFYFGRGGGLGIYVYENYFNVIADVRNCTFFDNYADSFGGAMYIYIHGRQTHHNFSVVDSNFTRNVAGNGSFGGGIQVAMLIRNFGLPSRLDFVRCHFEENVAEFGGGLSTVQVYSQGAGNNVSVSDTVFLRNRAGVGSALMFGSFLYVQNRNESYTYETRNNTFKENESPGGTFAAGFVNVRFKDTSTFYNNIGSGLRVVGSQVEVRGKLSFVGNNAENHEGGALFIQAFGQIKMYSESEMEFINNTGRIGAAIVVNVQRSSAVFSELVFNPQCFLVHKDSTRPPRDWNDVSIHFSGNRALVGPAIYISHLAHCSWYSAQPTSNISNEIDATFSIKDFPGWPLFELGKESNLASSQPTNPSSQKFYIQTEPVKMVSENSTTSPLKIRPGQLVSVNLVGRDEFGNPTYLIARVSDSRSGINLGAFRQATGGTITSEVENVTVDDLLYFEPELLPILPSDQVVNLSYGFLNLDPSQFNESEVEVILDLPYNVREANSSVLNIKLSTCQPGYVLQQRSVGDNLVVCECVTNAYNVLNCEEDAIVLRDGVWAGPEADPLPHLDFYPCPTSYCQCFARDNQTCESLYFQDDPGRQCHPNRKGVLCGSCVNGTSVGVLRTICRECSKENYYAIVFLVIGDVIVIGVILFAALKLHLVLPHSFKGLLFYIQTVYYVTEYFPISFFDIRKYMLYLGSGLGLYFPWDICLYPGMTAIVSYSPKFIPIVIATIMGVAAVLITYNNKYVSSSRDGRRYVWNAIYALILLLYAPLAHTCVSLLHCPETPGDQQEEEAYRWFLDADVMCFRGAGHIVLGLLAIFFLIVLTLLVPAVFIFTIVAYSKKVQEFSRRVKWMYEALTNGYRDSHETRWWVAWDLLRRLLLIILIVALPGRSMAPVLVLILAFSLHVFLRPYKKLWQNVFEGVILVNYIFLFLLRGTQPFLDNLSTYSGTQNPANRGKQLAAFDSVTWLFFPFYYAPIFLALVVAISYVTIRIVRWIKSKWEEKHAKTFELELERRRVSTQYANINTDYCDFDRSRSFLTVSAHVTRTEVSL